VIDELSLFICVWSVATFDWSLDTVCASAVHEVVGVVKVTPLPVVAPTLLVATTRNRYVVLGLRSVTEAETWTDVEPAGSEKLAVDSPYAVEVPYWK